MRKANYKKKQRLKNVGTATALTITLATSNVPTLAYATELETDVNITNSSINQELANEDEVVKEEEIAVQKKVTNQEVDKQSTVDNFNLNDWEHKSYSKDIILNKYIGTDTDIVIPGEFEGKQIKIGSIKN